MNFISELIKTFIYSVCACVSKNKKQNPTCSLSTTKTAYRQVPKDSKTLTGLNLNEHNNSSKLFCSLYCVSLTGVVQMVSRTFLCQRDILTDLYCNWPHR